MARGTDTRHHPGRKVDRAGWSAWQPSSSTTSSGKVVASSYATDDPEYAHRLDVTHNNPGFSTELDYVRQVEGRGGRDTEQYAAGPFRTQRRAEIAGRSLTDRAEADTAENYLTGRYYESADERRANERGLL